MQINAANDAKQPRGGSVLSVQQQIMNRFNVIQLIPFET